MNGPLPQRRGVSHRAVFAVLAFTLALAFVGAVYVYARYVRYVPSVFAHVPANFAVALRLDVEQAVVYEPFRNHVLPLLEAHRSRAPRTRGDLSLGGGAGSRLEAFRSATTIELGVDLRELAVAVDDTGNWIVLLGGHFRRDGVLAGTMEMLQREGIRTELRGGPERLVHGSGATFAVSSDGVLILASSEDLLLRSLPARTEASRFRSGAALSLLVGPDQGSPLGGATLDVLPGQEFPVELRLAPAAGPVSASDVEAVLSGKTGDFKLFEATGPWQVTRSEGGTRATAVLSRARFDAVVAELARSLAVLIGLEPTLPAGDQ